MSKEWKAAVGNNRKYAIQFSKNRTAENFELKRKYGNTAMCEWRKALTAYWYKKSEEMKSKPHDFFDTFWRFLNNKTQDAIPIFLKNKHEDDIIGDQKQVAETLANHLSTIASDISGNHMISLTENEFNNHSSVQMIKTIYGNSSFQFKHVNKKDLQDSFENLNPRKFCSDTGLMPKLMKKVAEGIAPSVMNLYNRCIETSNWPALWKRGELTPIFKKGNKHDLENYWPITMLSTIDKVFESLLSKQITHYFPWFCSLEDTLLCSNPVTYSWGLSAYMKRFVSLTNRVMSFWNKFNNNGPNENPWRQLHDILDHSILMVPSFTWLCLSFRNDQVRSNDWLVNPCALSFLMTKLWHRESKALLIPVDRMVTSSFLLIACFQSYVSLTRVIWPCKCECLGEFMVVIDTIFPRMHRAWWLYCVSLSFQTFNFVLMVTVYHLYFSVP